ncbi:hypothetical protein DL98DRAFT_238344 [Cadophora sp. DSE1049]|nr:hypothetical protein DL98DRAFT_238344 [Cadophora sp. DSE1049]
MAGADADVKFLQQLFFSQAKKTTATNGKTKIRVDFKKENIEKMVSYLRVRAGDNQQINFSAIVHSVKGVVKTIREMEQQLEKWDEYVATFEGEVQDVMKGVGELDLGGEVGSMEVVEVVETVQVVEEVRVGEEEPVGSVAGAFVRFKSWLDNQKTHEKAEAEEADGEQVENELRS